MLVPGFKDHLAGMFLDNSRGLCSWLLKSCLPLQVVDCRRILKWTYAYGFYRFTEDATYSNGTPIPADVLDQQKEFFEFNQV